MHEAFGSLTTRGRAFLAGGVTAILCGIVLGERDLVRIGLLVALLPVVTAVWAGRSHQRVSLRRSLEVTQIEVGRPVRVRLELHNAGRRTHPLLVEDQIPYALGSRPRFMVDPIPSGGSVTLDHTVRSDIRGGYRVGPLRARFGDPFGLLEMSRTFEPAEELVVTPRVDRLPPIVLGGSAEGTGETSVHAHASGNAVDVTVREYRTGDDLRRVHWRSSAHSGQLMVRREEQPWQARCTLLVDNRARAHRGRGASSTMETAVRAAASVATHLVGRGYQVRVVTASGELLTGPEAVDTDDAQLLLRRLATLPALPAPVLATDWVDEDMARGMFVGVLGAIDENDRPFFSRVGRLGGETYGLVLDVGAWAGEALPTPTAWLQSIGWRASTLSPGEPLATAWGELVR